jgi:hypothetical protein
MFITVLSFVLVSCNEEISADQSGLTFTQKDESKDFNVLYTGEWHFEATGLEGYYSPNKADIKDFTVELVSGKGNTRVTITLRNDLNENYNVALKVLADNNHAIVTLNTVADC